MPHEPVFAVTFCSTAGRVLLSTGTVGTKVPVVTGALGAESLVTFVRSKAEPVTATFSVWPRSAATGV